MVSKEIFKDLARSLVGPALWIALLLAMSSRAQGGVVSQESHVEPAGKLVIDVSFPPGVGANLDAHALGGRVEVDQEAITIEEKRLRLRTLGGSIRVHEL